MLDKNFNEMACFYRYRRSSCEMLLAPCLLKRLPMKESLSKSGQLRTKQNIMKSKSTMLMIVGLVACSLAAFAQDNAPATNTAPVDAATTPAPATEATAAP